MFMDIEWSGDQLQERVREWLPGYMVPIRILPWVDGLDGDIKPNEEMLQRLWGEYILQY